MLGHKGDLMLVHFRDSFDDLNQAELQLNRTRTAGVSGADALVSVGDRAGTVRLEREAVSAADRARSGSAHAKSGTRKLKRRWSGSGRPCIRGCFRRFPTAAICVSIPWIGKRGEDKNWYMLPIEERQRQMEEHGMVGRRYAGKVQQIITGSIGFDDWEWGVDLFAPEPLVFKKLIYEMRFDQVSAEYALFGQFFVGLRVPVAKLGEWAERRIAASSN